MTGPDYPPLSLVPPEPDQVPRLNQFRRAHPGITICAGPGYWQAQIPEPAGEQVITRYQLKDLLDKLDTLTSQPGSSPGGPPNDRHRTRHIRRGSPRPRQDVMILPPAQLAAITELADEWSFLWDKRRQLWIATQDVPDGEQFEEVDLDALLTRIGQLSG